MHPVLSVVVPIYNEEEVLPLLVERLRPVLDGTGQRYEVVAVDDGSKDASAVIMQRIRRTWPEFRIVRLRANAGHQAAISAGLHRARGDYMVTIDADLQDPPEVVAEMLSKAQEERLDVVYGVRNDRSTDTAFKRNTAQAFYATMRRLSGTEAPANAGDFRLMSRATVDAINALPEHHRVLRLVVPALGFPSGEVYYKRAERAAGESKYPLRKMIALSIDSLTAGSMAPLRLATWAGLMGVIGAVVILFYALFSSMSGRAVAGWTSTVMAVAAVGAVQLVCLGILGEYVGRMYSMMQGRPTYFVAHDTVGGEPDRDFTTEIDNDDPSAQHHGSAFAHQEPAYEPRHEPRHARPHESAPPASVAPAAAHPGDAAGGGATAVDREELALRDALAGTPDPVAAPAGNDYVDSLSPDSAGSPIAYDAAGEAAEPTEPEAAPVSAESAPAPAQGADVGSTCDEAAYEKSLVTASARADGAGSLRVDAPAPAVIDAEARQAVRRNSAKRVTPGSDETGR